MEFELVSEFVKAERRKALAADTLEYYLGELFDFAVVLRGQCDCPSLFAASSSTATRYDETLRIEGHNAKSRRCKLRLVYRFYEWLRESGRLHHNPFPRSGRPEPNTHERRRSSRQRKGAA